MEFNFYFELILTFEKFISWNLKFLNIQYEFSESRKHKNPTLWQGKLQSLEEEDDIVSLKQQTNYTWVYWKMVLLFHRSWSLNLWQKQEKGFLRSFVPKKSSEFSDTEKDKVALDTSLQLIIVESLDTAMLNQVINCSSAKHMWDTIELLMEGDCWS